MEPSAWADIKEIILYILSSFGPIFVFLGGKFILNKWEKKQKDIQIKREEQDGESKAEADEIANKQKEADLATIYEGIAKRAAEDVITKSDRLRTLEGEWGSRFDKLEQEIGNLRGENSGLRTEIGLLNQKNQALETENRDLKERVRILEQDINDRNCLDKGEKK